MLDLDETLVHSSFKPIPSPDYIIPVEIEGRIVDVYVLKRPWLDQFMAAIAGRFEVGNPLYSPSFCHGLHLRRSSGGPTSPQPGCG